MKSSLEKTLCEEKLVKNKYQNRRSLKLRKKGLNNIELNVAKAEETLSETKLMQ